MHNLTIVLTLKMSYRSKKNGLSKNVADLQQENIFDDIISDISTKTKTMQIEPRTEFVPDYYVYTDGACSNNGKPNAMAGIGIFFGLNDERNVSKRIEGKQSNNVAELTALIDLYQILSTDIAANKCVTIVSDSNYALGCVSTYGEKCYKKKWNVDIPNKELVRTAYELYKNKKNVKFLLIKAHTENSDVHSVGNDGADKLANLAIGLDCCPYNKQKK